MAVTFKVPKSPAKSIFEIDDFLGVDLTNNGTNIDEHRSPNAPNMTRYVPGKVRKRMGYSTEIVFGTGLNTNLAIGASENIDEFELNTYESGNFTTLYDLLYPKSHFDEDLDVYIEFEYMSDAPFWMTVAGRLNASPNEFTYIKMKGIIQSQYAINIIRAISYSETQTIKIRKMSVMYEQTEDYVWTKPPKYFVLTESNDPIYGMHSLKHGTFEGNRIVNVNRALETSNVFKDFNATTTASVLYYYGEALYPHRHYIVEFDYELSGDDCNVSFSTKWHKLTPTSETVHFRLEEENTSDTNGLVNAYVKSVGTSVLKIKNFSLLYDENENYRWSAAPEDSGKKFYSEDIYKVSTDDYAITPDSELVGGGEAPIVQTHYICDEDSNVKGYCKISFDLNASYERGSGNIKVGVATENNALIWEKVFTNNIAGEKFEIFATCDMANYANRIIVTFTESGSVYSHLTNIKVNALSINEDYYISTLYRLYHVGKKIYLRGEHDANFSLLYSEANEAISSSWQLGDSLYILDGKNIYSYNIGNETVIPLGESGYIPTVTIGKKPNGGGTPYDAFNMLQPGFYETFYVSTDDDNPLAFHLSVTELDNTEIKAWVLNSNGSWDLKKEGVDFTVYRNAGFISFFDSPGVSPLTGEDNVKVLAYKTFPGYKERVTKCTIGTLFGVNGASDRLFISGNPDYPNWDFYSEQYDATYFPDTGYSSLGLSSSKIVGYAIVNNYLATFKDEYEPSQSVFIREGDLITDPDTKIASPAFKLINTLQGNGVIAPHSFGYLQTEPLFLTRSGIYAITAQDITGEKYSQNRSFFLNGKLTEELNMENAYAVVYNDMYMLALNNQMYILDGLQPVRTDKSEPYATRQYAAFYWTDVPALCLWTEEQKLCFGTSDGRVCEFATDVDNLDSYNDNGKPIYCCWETPDLDGQLFYKNKSFRYLAIRMMSALKTSVALYYMARGSWNFVKEDVNTGIYFDFGHIDFSAFSFSTDRTDKVAHTKIRVKKVDKARFKIENNKLNEPFGLVNLALEFVESGNYKG